MGNMKFKNVEEYAAAKQRFFETHPEAPVAEDIECLNLIMRKEYAEMILRGEKPLEFRNYSDFYQKRLIDNEVAAYIKANLDNDEVVTFCNDIRQVRKIHFHNYNNSWFLDVECNYNDAFTITKGDIGYLQETYGVHDFDEELEMYEKANIEQRPYLFYFEIGKVLGTDLEVKPKEEEYVEICGGYVTESLKDFNKALDDCKKNKDIITFKVNKEEFNDIVNGQQRVFTKEIKPSKVSTYFKTDKKGDVLVIDGVPQFKKYDAIQFTNKEDSYTCQINNADLLFMDEPNYGMVSYSELDGEEIDYTAGVIAYTLGEETKNS